MPHKTSFEERAPLLLRNAAADRLRVAGLSLKRLDRGRGTDLARFGDEALRISGSIQTTPLSRTRLRAAADSISRLKREIPLESETTPDVRELEKAQDEIQRALEEEI